MPRPIGGRSAWRSNRSHDYAALRARGRQRRLGIERLEDRRLLTASVDPAYAALMATLQDDIQSGSFVVDPGNYTIAEAPGIDFTTSNVDQAGEVETTVWVDSLGESVLSAIEGTGARVTGTDPYSMAVNAWVTPGELAALEEVSGVTSLMIPIFGVSNTWSGAVDSQGLNGNDPLRAELARQNFAGLTGAGSRSA
ncbi:MAG: hypothetical protein K2Y37_20705 [Pirellulales bacterium]|nr:hypothetical protein [Pirellulales bacterium]